MTAPGQPPELPGDAPEALQRVYEGALAITAIYPLVLDQFASLQVALARSGEGLANRWVRFAQPGAGEHFVFVDAALGAGWSLESPPSDVSADEIPRVEVPHAPHASAGFLAAARALDRTDPRYRGWIEIIDAAALLVERGGGDTLLPQVREALIAGDLDLAERQVESRHRDVSAYGGDAACLTATVALLREVPESARAAAGVLRESPHSPAAVEALCAVVRDELGVAPLLDTMHLCTEEGRRWIGTALDAPTRVGYGMAMREACRWLWGAWGLGKGAVADERATEPDRRAQKVTEEHAVRLRDVVCWWFSEAAGDVDTLALARRDIARRASSTADARRLAREWIDVKLRLRRSQLDELLADAP